MDPIELLRQENEAQRRRDRNREAEDKPSPSCGSPMQPSPMRSNARMLLEARIEMLRRQASELEALLWQLPAKMTPEADEGLYSILSLNFRY